MYVRQRTIPRPAKLELLNRPTCLCKGIIPIWGKERSIRVPRGLLAKTGKRTKIYIFLWAAKEIANVYLGVTVAQIEPDIMEGGWEGKIFWIDQFLDFSRLRKSVKIRDFSSIYFFHYSSRGRILSSRHRQTPSPRTPPRQAATVTFFPVPQKP